MKKSTQKWLAAAGIAVAAGSLITMLNPGKKARITRHLRQSRNKEKLAFVKEKLEQHKARIEKSLERINAKLAGPENISTR